MDRQFGKPAPAVSYAAPAPVVGSCSPAVSYAANAPVVECVAPSVSYVTLAPVDAYIAQAPAVDATPAPGVKYISPAPVGYAAPAPVVGYIAPSSSYTVFLSRQRRLRRTSLLAVTPRAERASRLELVRRDSVQWTRPGTCLTCMWSG